MIQANAPKLMGVMSHDDKNIKCINNIKVIKDIKDITTKTVAIRFGKSGAKFSSICGKRKVD